MQTCLLPQGICNALDKINRSFLWGDTESQKKMHLVKWDEVNVPEGSGGLGLNKTKEANIAHLAKTGWKILQNEDVCWANVFRQKYFKNQNILDYNIKSNDSYFWKGIVRSFNIAKEGLKWRISKGDKVSLWFDHWIGSGPLFLEEGINIDMNQLDLRVSDIIDNGFNWSFDVFLSPLPYHIMETIRGIHIPTNYNSEDKLIWGESNDGVLSAKGVYRFLRKGDLANFNDTKWKWIWNMPCT